MIDSKASKSPPSKINAERQQENAANGRTKQMSTIGGSHDNSGQHMAHERDTEIGPIRFVPFIFDILRVLLQTVSLSQENAGAG
jgi:hypothetical protein